MCPIAAHKEKPGKKRKAKARKKKEAAYPPRVIMVITASFEENEFDMEDITGMMNSIQGFAGVDEATLTFPNNFVVNLVST